MIRRISSHAAPILTTLAFALAVPMLACEQKSDSEKLTEKAKDALDMREHEGLKDAGEDAQQAIEDAGSAIKEEAKELKEKAQEAVSE